MCRGRIATRSNWRRDLDPGYGAAFDAATASGVEAIAYGTDISQLKPSPLVPRWTSAKARDQTPTGTFRANWPYIEGVRKRILAVDDRSKGRLTKDGIRIYEAEDFAGMKRAGELAAHILDRIAPLVVPGATDGLDRRSDHAHG